MSNVIVCDRCEVRVEDGDGCVFHYSDDVYQDSNTRLPRMMEHGKIGKDLCGDCMNKLDRFMDGQSIMPRITVGPVTTDVSFSWIGKVRLKSAEAFMEQDDTRNY